MNQQVNYNIAFKKSGDDKLIAAIESMDSGMEHIEKAVDGIGTGFGKTIDRINKNVSTIKFDSILNQIDRVGNGLNRMAGPGSHLSTEMFDLSANTGVAGKKLEEIEKYARANAKTFGGDASSSVRSYNLLLSKLTPEIANTPAALDAMGNSVSTLSKRMGGDTVAATGVLTTAMNQFQVSTADPIAASKTMALMMNTMAAGAAEGSAELPEVGAALEQAGMAAKGANVSFEETNAAIQVLDKAGKKGSEGGVALRNTLAILGQGRFMPKDVQTALKSAGVDMAKLGDNSIPLAQRLQALSPIMGDSALLTKLFGMENQNAARALISGIPEMERLTTAITGTNTAYEQAAIVMESPEEKNKRFQASVDDFKISLFNATGGAMGYMQAITDISSTVTDILPLMNGLGSAISFVTSAEKLQAFWTGVVSKATAVWEGILAIVNAEMWANPLTWVIGLIIALVATIGYVVYAYDGWGEAWDNLVKFLEYSWSAFKESFNLIWLNIQDSFLSGIELIEKAWFKLKSLWDEDGAAAGLEKINNQQNDRAAAILESKNKLADNLIKANESFDKISLKANGKGFGDMKTEVSDKLGIAAPTIPGTSDNGGKNIAPPGATGKGAKTTEAIATGGTKSTNNYINLKSLINQLIIKKAGFNEAVDEMQDVSVDGLIRVLTLAQSL